MLTISVRLLHGTIRAGSPDDTVMAGGDPVGEWPPSPARLFSALVAADGTGERSRVTDGSELLALEQLELPAIFADAPIDLFDTTLEARYVVREGKAKNVVQNYPARQSTLVHSGVLTAPRHPVVEYHWDADLPSAVSEGLSRRAARVSYLGCADSPVVVKVFTDADRTPPSLPKWTVGSVGTGLPVPYPGFLEGLDSAFESWSTGVPSKRSWIPTRRAYYSTERGIESKAQPTVIWLRLGEPQPARRALLLTETLRAALLDGVDRELSNTDGARGTRAPWMLHGHDIPTTVERPYQLVRVLPLANVGSRYADGAIHGLAVWLPPGVDSALVELIRTVLFRRVHELRASGLKVVIEPRRAEAGAWSVNPRRWTGPARAWFSVNPAVVERGRKRGPTPDDVRKWFANAGHPVPAKVRISSVPTRPGVARLRPSEVHRSGRDRHPYVWLEIDFDEPVTGPLCVGRSRSFGMGLLAPAGAERGEESSGGGEDVE